MGRPGSAYNVLGIIRPALRSAPLTRRRRPMSRIDPRKTSRYRGLPAITALLQPHGAGLPACGNILNHGGSTWRFAFRNRPQAPNSMAVRRNPSFHRGAICVRAQRRSYSRYASVHGRFLSSRQVDYLMLKENKTRRRTDNPAGGLRRLPQRPAPGRRIPRPTIPRPAPSARRRPQRAAARPESRGSSGSTAASCGAGRRPPR